MQDSQILIGMDWVTPDYINTMGMKLIAGRNFHSDGTADSNSIIINETLAKLITKNPAEAAGQIINRDDTRFNVIGVVKDFVYNNIYGSVAPMIMYSDPTGRNTSFVNIRFKTGNNYETSLDKVKTVVTSYNPGNPFEYKFVDEEFDQLFKTESLVGKLAFLFAGLAIFISCLGIIWTCCIYCRKKEQGDQHPKDPWCVSSQTGNDVISRFPEACRPFLPDCLSIILVADEQLAERL